MAREGSEPGFWARRLLWFAGLWLAGVATVAALSWILKLLVTP